MNDKSLLQVKKIIKKWHAYRSFVKNKGVSLSKVKCISDLPVLDKEFVSHAIHTIPLFKIRNIVPSSGYAGVNFSFGLFGDTELKKATSAIDKFLVNRFDIANKKTLIINLLPGSVSIPSSIASIASIGTRIDTAISTIKSFESSFEQILLVGEPLFIKNLIESGAENSIQWKNLPLFIIVGGEWISESFRTYLEEIVGFQRVYSSMGMAELGLNYFYETDETIALRRLFLKNTELLKSFFGSIGFCPMFFRYNEDDVYVETVKENKDEPESILITATNPGRVLPLIRYKSGDKGKKLSWDEINRILNSKGYKELLNTAGKLSVLAHFGKGKKILGIYPEKIKEVIYNSYEIASTTTGNFFLNSKRNGLSLNIQLNEGLKDNLYLKNLYNVTFRNFPVSVKIYPFQLFPVFLNYEKKVQYIYEDNNSGKRGRKKIEL